MPGFFRGNDKIATDNLGCMRKKEYISRPGSGHDVRFHATAESKMRLSTKCIYSGLPSQRDSTIAKYTMLIRVGFNLLFR